MNSEYHCVYVHMNKANLKVYVGYSSQPKRRWRLTKDAAFCQNDRDYNHPFSRAIRKYGWDGFTHQIIEEFDNKPDALEAEKFWIEFFRSNRNVYGKEFGYNMHEGGNCPPSHKGRTKTSEHRAKIGQANKLRVDKQKDKKIVELYLSGKNIREVAQENGCGEGLVKNALKRANIPIRPKIKQPSKVKPPKPPKVPKERETSSKAAKFSTEIILKVVDLYKTGTQVNDIVKQLNEAKIAMSRSYVWHILYGEAHTDITGIKPKYPKTTLTTST